MKTKKALSLVGWLLLLSIAGKSQYTADSFAYRSNLDTIGRAAFYRIELAPSLIAKCRQDLGDLRIADKDGHFIPYVLKSDQPVLSTDGFKEFPILSNERLKDSSTEIILQNKASANLNYILLVMQNSSAYRTVTLSGSNDKLHWYAIREHIALEEAGSDTADHFVQSVAFPSSSYPFFKLIFDDKGLLPLHILQAGIYTRSFTHGLYRDLPVPVIQQKDSSDRHSYITLRYPEAYRIDRLDLDLRGPALFRRYARIYQQDSTGKIPVMEIVLDPLNKSFRIPPVKTKELLVDISNDDNAPLRVAAALAGQLDQYLLAYLQPGTGYRLLAGNDGATAPQYDLKYFIDTVGKDLQEITAGPMLASAVRKAQTVAGKKDHSGVLLWCIIGAALLLLILLSAKMIKAIPDENGKDRL